MNFCRECKKCGKMYLMSLFDRGLCAECEKAEQEPCDVVSRQAVIQTLNKMDRYTATELTLCDTDKKFPANEVFIVDDVYEQITEQLPSVRPQEQAGHWDEIVKEHKCYARDDTYTTTEYHCSECGAEPFENEDGFYELSNYCPSCGARMCDAD